MALGFIAGRVKSIGFALAGIVQLVRTQRNAWVHLAATTLVIVAGFMLHVSAEDWCWLIVAMTLVWATEGMNTALEVLADAVCPEWHPLVGRAKDVAAGAVLLAVIGAVGIGLCVFTPHLQA